MSVRRPLLALLLAMAAWAALALPAPARPRFPDFVGAIPTEDPATWRHVPGEHLLGALKAMDRTPGAELSLRQLQKIARLASEAAGPGAELQAAEAAFV